VPRLLADNQKENRVEISQELLANANGNENILKSQQETRHGFMGTMLEPRSNHRSGWGIGLLNQKKHGWVGQRSR